jgi:hypothetical protein
MTSNLNPSKANINRVAPALTETNTSFISISPNPTTGSFTIINSKFIAGNTYPLDVYNASGANVLQKTLSNVQEAVSLSAPDGTYFVNVNTQDGLAVKKITKGISG